MSFARLATVISYTMQEADVAGATAGAQGGEDA